MINQESGSKYYNLVDKEQEVEKILICKGIYILQVFWDWLLVKD